MANNKATRITYPIDIVNAYSRSGKFNGGWTRASKRAYYSARQSLTKCLLEYRRPQLYHLCFLGKTNAEHKELLHALVQKLNRKGIPCEWWGAREVDADKGEHLHIYIVADAEKAKAKHLLNNYPNRFLGRLAQKKGIVLYANRPLDAIHEGRWFVELPWLGSSKATSPLAQARLDDALVWMTYPFKARGKPESAKGGQIYPASKPNRKRAAREVVQPGYARVLAPATEEKIMDGRMTYLQ